jgi:SRSO17 transposase
MKNCGGALTQIERLLSLGAPRHGVLADAGYGTETAFRERLGEWGLVCVVGVTGQLGVWCVRKMQLRSARWDAFDLDAGIWTLAKENTETRPPNRIPLAETNPPGQGPYCHDRHGEE